MKHILKTIATFFLAAGIFAFIYSPPVSAACPTLTNSLTGTINIQTTGTYDVWSRIQSPDATNNSYILEVDDTTCGIVVGDFTIPSNVWTWVNYRDSNTASKISLPLTAGVHTVRLGTLESGVKLDRIILSLSNVACSPSGTGDNCLVVPTTSPTPVTTQPTTVPTATPTPVSTDSTSPSVTIISPSNGSIVTRRKTLVISANASDNAGVTKVEFYVNGALKCTDATALYTCSWNVPGKRVVLYTITAKAYDATGNIGQSSITVSSN